MGEETVEIVVEIRYENGTLNEQRKPNGRFKITSDPQVKPGDRVTWKLVNPQGVQLCILWFPDIEKRPFGMEQQPFRGDGSWQTTLTVRADCPDGTYPYALYLKMDPDAGILLHKGGDQLAEGLSHPVIIIRKGSI